MNHSTFFILGDRETNGENIFIFLSPPYFSILHPNTLPIPISHITHINHGNTDRDKKRVPTFHPSLFLPGYNGRAGCIPLSSLVPYCFCKTSQGVSSHFSLDSSMLTSIMSQKCDSDTKMGGVLLSHFLRLSYLNLPNV